MRCEAFLKTKSSLLGALRFGGGRFFVWDDGEGDGSGKRIHAFGVIERRGTEKKKRSVRISERSASVSF